MTLIPWEELASVPRMQSASVVAPGIRLNADELDALFDKRAIWGFRRKADHLGIATTTLFRAYHGGCVSADFIYAVRTTWPKVPYQKLFREEPARRLRDAA